MKNKHYLLALILLFLIKNFTFAQTDRATEAFENAPYIFEATVTDLKPVQDETGKYFISYKMHVTQKLKGDKKLKEGDTIDVVSVLPDGWHIISGELIRVDDFRPLSSQRGLQAWLGAVGVFFMERTVNSNTFTSYQIFSDAFFYRVVHEKFDKEERKKYNTIEFIGFGKTFDSIDEFNEYLISMKMPALGEHTIKKKDATFSERSEKLSEEEYAKRAKNAEDYQKRLEERRERNRNDGQPKSGETITFEVQNEEVTGTAIKYYEFDIVVSGNTSNTYLDNAAFVIEFNTSPFGGNLSANNKVTITKGANFNNATYYDPMDNVTDDAVSAIRFGIGSDYTATSWNRTQITPVPQQLLHLKFEIASCFGVTDIAFTDIMNVSFVDIYTTTATINPMDTPYLGYDSPNYVQPQPYLLCAPPVIHSFSPAIISAGTNSVLTISGSGFGSDRGNGQVQFKNASNGGATHIDYLNDYDYISWTDSEIKIRLPYYVDTFLLKFHTGSGLFKVKRNDGEVVISPYALTINYAIMNASAGVLGTSSYRKIPYRHVSNSAGGYARQFSLDTSITNNPQMSAIVHKVLHDWSCATSINWVVVDTVTQQGHIQDGKSVIYLEDTLSGEFELGSAQILGGFICTDPATNEEFVYWGETDIRFVRHFSDTALSWFFDTTMNLNLPPDQHDFYRVVQHELGHAHYLGHVVNTSDLMHYGGGRGPVNAASRLHLYSSYGTMDGGIDVINESYDLNLSGCSDTYLANPLYLKYCGVLSLNDKLSDESGVVLAPNPFVQTFDINFGKASGEIISYTLYDVLGNAIMTKNLGFVQDNHIETIDLRDAISGVYILSVRKNDKKYNYRAIKL